MTNIKNPQTEDEIIRELEGDKEKSLDEDRSVGTQDEGGDDDPSDTTPSEASELADEGGELFEEERKRHETHDPFQE